MFGIAGIATDFAPWFFGSEFSSVGKLIMTIAPTIFFVSWANVIRTQYLIPLHNDKIYIVSVWLGAIVNLILNAALIPRCGALGAVIGTILAEGTVAIYQTLRVVKELPIGIYIKNGLYYMFAGFVMFIIVRFIGSQGDGGLKTLVLEVIFGVVTYAVLCIPYIIKRHNSESKNLLENIRRKIHRDK